MTSGNSGETYAIFGDPEGERHGALWFVEGEITDGGGNPAGRRVFCLYQSVDGTVQQVNPAILWDLEPARSSEKEIAGSNNIGAFLEQRSTIEDYTITQVLLPFREEIAECREREGRIKEKYGLRSLDYLIQESNQKILDYQARQSQGEQVDLPLLNEQRNLKALEQRRTELEREIKLERNLTVSEPRILGAAAVIPLGKIKYPLPAKPTQPVREADAIYAAEIAVEEGIDAERRAEIEAIGMQIALQYEREQGWQPEDVSGENHGFDVRSTKYGEDGSFADIRYIEVKARARSGAIRLSANEWKKARHFGEKFWLYIVTQAATDSPQLYTIQNPATHFQEGEDIFATGFVIPEEKWGEKGVFIVD